MNPDLIVLMELQISGSQYAARVDGEWKSSDPCTVQQHGLPPHFNLDAIALHRQGTKIAARCQVPSLDLDVHADEVDIRTMQVGVNQEIEYTLRAEGFEGVVDQSSPNGGLHIRLKTSVTKAELQQWFASQSLPFPEYFGPETKNKLGLPAFGGGPAWSLQDPAVKVRGLNGYVELWASLPEDAPVELDLGDNSPDAVPSPSGPTGQDHRQDGRIKTSVPIGPLPAPDLLIQARLRQACGDSPIPRGQRYRSQPAIVDRAIFKIGLGGLPRDVLIANLVVYMIGRGRVEKPSKIARQIAALVDGAMARRAANRARAKAHSPETSDPVNLIVAAVLSRHKIGDRVPISGKYIAEVTGIQHRRGHAEVKRRLESSGYLRRVSRGSNLKGRCDLYLVIAE